VLVDRIEVEESGGESLLRARVSTARRSHLPFTLEYAFEALPGSAVARSGDPFVAALVLPAMALGEDLEIAAPLSPRLSRNVGQAIDIYRAWSRGLPSIRVLGQGSAAPSEGAGAALCFTAGVDSFYSLLKSEGSSEDGSSDISHLLFVHGFDIALRDTRRRASAAARIQRVAEATRKRAILVRSNLREVQDRVVSWDLHHGAALAGVGLALSGLLKRCVIPSSWAYQHLRPWGSHPLLDPLWSTESLAFVHDGCEARRIEKVQAISDSSLALDNLRVCWEHLTDDYNCARCEKCVATMVMLHGEGKLADSATFPRHFDYGLLRSLRFEDPATFSRLGDTLQVLRLRGGDPELADCIERALRAGRARVALRRARKRFRRNVTALHAIARRESGPQARA
jgi:hypothetical protein